MPRHAPFFLALGLFAFTLRGAGPAAQADNREVTQCMRAAVKALTGLELVSMSGGYTTNAVEVR